MSEDVANYGRRAALSWEDVKSEARDLFNVWAIGSEMAWAGKSWAMLAEKGLTGYANAVEESRVRVRLLALASLYWDFC